MRHILVVSLALAALGLALGACSPLVPQNEAKVILPKPGDAAAVTRISQIVGVWQVYSTLCTPGYMVIRDNATYVWSCTPDGRNGVPGKFHFAKGRFLILNNLCGQEGEYAIHMVSDDPHTLKFTPVDDPCEAEVKTLTTQNVTWVSPLP